MIKKELIVVGNMVKFYEYGHSTGKYIVGQIKKVDTLSEEILVECLSGFEWIVGIKSLQSVWEV